MKIVINKCYGGFGLSVPAMKRLAALGFQGHEHAIERTDRRLVQVVEELGAAECSGRFAELKIVEVPDGVEWELEEYDGMESIRERSRRWD